MASGIERRKIIGVMGSGKRDFDSLAGIAGRVIAEEGYHLLTGGGECVMTAAARAFTLVSARKGLSFGIIRAKGEKHLKDRSRYRSRTPNPYVEVPIRTHLPYSGEDGMHKLSRNHINVLTSEVVIVLPGEEGTECELQLAVDYGRPVILFIGEETVHASNVHALTQRYGNKVNVAGDEAELRRLIRRLAGEPVEKVS